MTRVALVTSSFLPRFGGVEEHVLHVARHLRAAGHHVVVWSVDQGDTTPDEVDGIPVRYLPCPLPARNPRSLAGLAVAAPRAARAWSRAYRRDRPDVLHVHCYGPNGPWASAVSALTRTPLVVSAHGETFMDADDVFGASAFLRAALTRSLRRARAVTACSAYVRDDLERRFGLAAGRGVVVPNGIDLDEPAGAPPDWLPERYVLAVGRLVQPKGFDLLLDAFARADLPGVQLVLGGDGPERAALARQAERLGIAGRVSLPGRLTRPDVVATAERALAFVVPSRVEAFGIVVLEGWRAGVPVVVTSHGGPPEFVEDGRTGLVVDPFDSDALARALERLAADPEFAAHLGAAGRAEAARYPWSGVAAGYAALYPGAGSGLAGLAGSGSSVAR